MLKRQIDILLMKQAVADEGLLVPGGPVDDLVDGFLTRVGATRGQMAGLMVENGVSQAQIDAWFEDSRTVNTFVQQVLMVGREQTERNTVSGVWLDGPVGRSARSSSTSTSRPIR